MGGRGLSLSPLPEYFAAIMPLQPHHEPYHITLAEDVAHLPHLDEPWNK